MLSPTLDVWQSNMQSSSMANLIIFSCSVEDGILRWRADTSYHNPAKYKESISSASAMRHLKQNVMESEFILKDI